MKIKRVLFDMDEVLVNQKHGLAKMEGITPEHMMEVRAERRAKDPHFDYIMHLIKKHIDDNVFIKHAPLPEFETFKKVIDHLIATGVEVAILSSATSNQDIYAKAVAQKRVWLIRHGLGHIRAMFAHGSSEKQLWAEEGILLIDDYSRNIKEFTEAGGSAILHYDINVTLAELKKFGLIPENFNAV